AGRARGGRAGGGGGAWRSSGGVAAMEAAARAPFAELRVDGGASVMDLLCELQADLSGIPVRRPRHTETTALGAAFLAGRGAGVWGSDTELAGLWRLDREFLPAISRDEAGTRMAGWRRAVERSRDWAQAE